MKKIYIVLTHTGTFLSRIIKSFTKDEFSHSSIALDADLEKMYSFGRLKPNNPFIGGFVHEFIHQGTFRKFYNTRAKVYSLAITEGQYEALKYNIQYIQKERENYEFNVIGLFAAGVNIKIGKEHAFYCAEFVKYVMEKAGIDTGLPDIVKPEDFKNMKDLKVVYEGYLRDYTSPRVNITDLLMEKLLYRKIENMS